MTHTQAKRALELLRAIKFDIESMRSGRDCFGPFSAWLPHATGTATVEWPNLAITGRDIAAFLESQTGE